MITHNDLTNMEARLAGLTSRLTHMEGAEASCRSNTDQYAHSQHMGAPTGPIAAARKELNNVATEYVMAKITAWHWPPLELIDRMKRGPVQLVAPTDDYMKAALLEFLTQVPDTATIASLKELIGP